MKSWIQHGNRLSQAGVDLLSEAEAESQEFSAWVPQSRHFSAGEDVLSVHCIWQ